MNDLLQAEVIAVFPDKVRIMVDNIDEFNLDNVPLKVILSPTPWNFGNHRNTPDSA